MRRVFGSILVVAAVAACASSGSSSNTGAGAAATPAATPAASGATASTGGSAPCATPGTCRIAVQAPDDQIAGFRTQGANFKVYAGCPRTLGFRSASDMRAKVPETQNTNTSFVVPTLPGRYATVGIFFGTAPQKWVVVDFGASTTAKPNFGFIYNGADFSNDKLIDNTNASNERKWCST